MFYFPADFPLQIIAQPILCKGAGTLPFNLVSLVSSPVS